MRTHPNGTERASQRDALPLTSGEIRSAVIGPREDGVEIGEVRRTRVGERGTDDVVRCAVRRDVVAHRQLEFYEILKDHRQPPSPLGNVHRFDVDAVDLDEQYVTEPVEGT